jgi:hypothetical protein
MVGGEETATTQQMMFEPGARMDYPTGAEVRVIDDFLPQDIFELARTESEKMYRHGKNFRTNESWGQHLIKNSVPVMITHVMDQQVNDGIAVRVSDMGEYSQRTLYHYWPVGSYIPWHDDGHHKAAVTLYLSEHDVDDGGYFMYDDGKGIKAVRPKLNRAVFVTGGIHHCVTTVNAGSKIRRSLQVWLRQP